MGVLEVKELTKVYPTFTLNKVSFSLEKGKITGFIGRNGAGKSTTLKSIMNFVHPDHGEVVFFDLPFEHHELEIKQNIGFVSGGVNYYGNKKIKTITNVTKRFYKKWDEASYRKYMNLFKLDEKKTPTQLSEGMKVKYALTLALSHNADLLILDEPTSGLDPVSRDELLDIFIDLCDKGITILFSTHITSDLEKCADNIIYIKEGQIIAESEQKAFVDSYRIMSVTKEQYEAIPEEFSHGMKRTKEGYTALVKTKDVETVKSKIPGGENLTAVPADLESIMIHIEKE